MSDETKNHLRYRDKIVEEKNIEALFLLKDNSDFSIALHEILSNRHDENPSSLNEVQLNLFLCMHLENAGQADHILSFLQEWYPNHSTTVVKSLHKIGAIKSSKIIEQAINLLPADGSWFYDKADEDAQDLMDKLGSQFLDYPDGFIRDLYRNMPRKTEATFNSSGK